MGEEDTGKTPNKFPWFEPFACEGCGDCITVCPTGSLELLDNENQKVPKAWVTNPDACIGRGKVRKPVLTAAVQMRWTWSIAQKTI